ncbi:hypothetical protein, partial [Bartonella sp. ML70XJBT.G]|uniref:hypothetical protein n=2 Tax=Bartonella sp. ML70XJBT.G TaxID=3019093 RepID=UPI002360A1ED
GIFCLKRWEVCCMVNILLDNIAVGGLMLQSSWFLPFLLLLCFWVVSLAFLYRMAARRKVTGWMFWWWMISYGILVAFFGFLFAGVKREGMSAELLWKGVAFSCLFGIVLGLLYAGVKSMPALWGRFVKAVVFCCMVGVFLLLAFVGARNIALLNAIFWTGLVFALLLKLLLVLLIREKGKGFVQSLSWLAEFVLSFCCCGTNVVFITGIARDMGGAWGVLLKGIAFLCITGVILYFALVGVKSREFMWGGSLKLISLLIVLDMPLAWLIWKLGMWRGDGVSILKHLVFCNIVGVLLGCAVVGAKSKGLAWLWFSKDWVFYSICGFLSLFLYEGARCALVVGEAFWR